MLNWAEYTGEINSRFKELGKLAPDVTKAFVNLEASVEKARHLDKKTRELISLAVAVTTRCDGCIASHVEEAIKAGVTREEMAEALGVAISLNAGAALVFTTRTLDCYDDFSQGK